MKRRSQRWVAGRRKTPHAPPRAPRATRLHGASDSRAWRVRSTLQLLQRIADVIDDVILPSHQRAVSGADVLMTWLLARLLTWRMTSACHVTQSTVMGADVALTWLSTWLMTSADPTHDPVNRSTGSDPTRVNGQPGHGSTRTSQRVNRPGQRFNGSTRSTVNRVRPDPPNGQPGHGSTRPGQRSTGSTGSNPTRSTQPSPMHALPHAPTLLVAREGA